jgi:hypothetical protein
MHKGKKGQTTSSSLSLLGSTPKKVRNHTPVFTWTSESNFTKDSPPNSMDSMGNTPLCEAIEGKEWDTARELVSKRGANVNLPTYHLKETPLHLVQLRT